MEEQGLTAGTEVTQEETQTEETVPGRVDDSQAQTSGTEIAAPEGLSNKEWWDAEKGQLKTDVVIEELNRQTKRAEDLRKKLSNGVTTPAKAEEYEVTPSDEVKDLLDTKSEIFTGLQQIALKQGLSKEQFSGFVNDYLAMCVEKGVISKPQTEEELKAAQEKYVADQKKILGANADEQIQSAVSFIETQYRKGILDEAEKKELRAFADKSAVTIRALNKLREMAGQPVVPVQNAQNDGLPPDSELIEKWATFSNSKQMEILQQRIKLGRPTKFLQ